MESVIIDEHKTIACGVLSVGCHCVALDTSTTTGAFLQTVDTQLIL